MVQDNVDGEGHFEGEGRVGGQSEGQTRGESPPEEDYAQINLDLDEEKKEHRVNEEEETYNKWGTITRPKPQSDDDDDTYNKWSTLTRIRESLRETRTGTYCTGCSLKRAVLVLAVLCISLTIAVISLSSLLGIHCRQNGCFQIAKQSPNTSNKPNIPDMTSPKSTISGEDNVTETTEQVYPITNTTSTSFSTTSKETRATLEPTTIETTTTATTTITTTITTTTTTTTIAPTTMTTSSSGNCTGRRLCHSCSSFHTRCPANGTMGDTIEFGMVEQCDCTVPCFNEVRNGREVHRGCVTGKGSIWEEKARNLDCKPIVNGAFACFCFGYLCNERDMTPYVQG